jgi:tRNA A37 threonylcarbamoyladenosine synthetase subunit TsaC/SUA5/YrdC
VSADAANTGQHVGRPDIDGDLRRIWEVLERGGIAIFPTKLGYPMVGSSPEATRRIIETKGRGMHKRQGMVMDDVLEREIHVLDQRKRDMIDCITKDYDLPLGVIASYRPDHPFMASIDPYLLKTGTARGTVSTALNAGGPFHAAIGRLCRENLRPAFASSANLTGTGGRRRVADLQPEIRAAADIIIDYGISAYHLYQRSATQINFDAMEVVRIGACYELIADVLLRHFHWQLPPDPGREVNPSGHLQEFALRGLQE